jgi:hypothetical protein
LHIGQDFETRGCDHVITPPTQNRDLPECIEPKKTYRTDRHDDSVQWVQLDDVINTTYVTNVIPVKYYQNVYEKEVHTFVYENQGVVPYGQGGEVADIKIPASIAPQATGILVPVTFDDFEAHANDNIRPDLTPEVRELPEKPAECRNKSPKPPHQRPRCGCRCGRRF